MAEGGKMVRTDNAGDLPAESAARILAAHPIFSIMDADDQRLLLTQCAPRNFAPGDVLFREGDVERFAYIVLDGEVEVQVSVPGGQTIQMAVVGSNSIIGEVAAFSDLPRTATVIARTPVHVLTLDRNDLTPIVQRSPDVAYRVISALGRRLHTINRPLALMTYAVNALEQDEFDPGMLQSIAAEGSEFSTFASAFSRMAEEIREKHSRRAEMEAAARIQRSILPQSIGTTNNAANIHAVMHPAKEIGGDFFDYFMADDRRLVFLVADVSGKGVPAALFMAVTRTVLRSVAQHASGPAATLAQANRLICEENQASMFVTLFYGELDLPTGRFRYCNAGHNDAYLLRGKDEPIVLPPTGIAIGFSEDAGYRAAEHMLSPGDAIFLYTDGVTEAFNREGETFGDERLVELMQDLRNTLPKDLVSGVVDAVDRFADGAEQSDDITCLALSYRPGL